MGVVDIDYAIWDYRELLLNYVYGNRKVAPVGEVCFFKETDRSLPAYFAKVNQYAVASAD